MSWEKNLFFYLELGLNLETGHWNLSLAVCFFIWKNEITILPPMAWNFNRVRDGDPWFWPCTRDLLQCLEIPYPLLVLIVQTPPRSTTKSMFTLHFLVVVARLMYVRMVLVLKPWTAGDWLVGWWESQAPFFLFKIWKLWKCDPSLLWHRRIGNNISILELISLC